MADGCLQIGLPFWDKFGCGPDLVRQVLPDVLSLEDIAFIKDNRRADLRSLS